MSSTGVGQREMSTAFALSVASVCWTVVSSTLSIGIGVRSHVVVLIAFGAVGVVDAVGSVALGYHFHHARRHDQLSEEIEAVAHRIVLVGLATVGLSEVVGGTVRVVQSGSVAASGPTGIVLAAASAVILSVLSVAKQRVGRRIGSNALCSDGHVSGVGAVLGVVTLVGVVATRWLGWPWADGFVTILVGIGALGLAWTSWSSPADLHRPPRT
jgi:divalent metal cation (Fe/Co/Zn/Cd) transporter